MFTLVGGIANSQKGSSVHIDSWYEPESCSFRIVCTRVRNGSVIDIDESLCDYKELRYVAEQARIFADFLAETLAVAGG